MTRPALIERFVGCRTTDAAAFLAFLALAALFLWPLWVRGPDAGMIGAPSDEQTGQPSDFVRQFYPYRNFVAGAWGSGRPPLWNPHQYAGTPAWGDPQQAVLYPWRLTQIPLAIGGRRLPLWAVELEALAHLALGAWFTYLLTRRLGAPWSAALVAGLTFGWGGYLTGYPLDQLAVLDTAVWIPATLWALTAAVQAAGAGDRVAQRRWTLLAAAATALSALAGHPQTAMYGLAVGVAWLAWRLVTRRRRWPVVAVAGLWLVGATALSAAQWLPSLRLWRLAAPRFEAAERLAGFPPGDLVQILAPGVISTWSPLYVGIPALVLATWGMVAVRGSRFWSGLAVAGWLVSLGGHGPVYPLLLRLVPAVGLFRHQERAAVVASLGLAVASGLALAELMRRPPVAARRVAGMAAVLGAVVLLGAAVGVVRPGLLEAVAAGVGFALPAQGGPAILANALALSALWAFLTAVLLAWRGAGRLRAQALAVGLALVVALDLFSVNAGTALVPRQPVFPSDPIVEALLPLAGQGRVSSEARLPGGPNAASVFRFYDVTGDSPMQLAWVQEAVASFPEMVWWRLLNVHFVVTGRSFEPDAPLTELVRLADRALYRVELPAQPAWVVTQVQAAPPDWLPPPDFDPQRTLVVEPPVAGALRRQGETGGPSGQAQLLGLGRGRARVQASLPAPGAVVLSTAYDPGWHATARGADGRRLTPPVLQAYRLLPAVWLPAGEWVVEWTYRPNVAIVGLVMSGLTLIIGVWLWRASSPGG